MLSCILKMKQFLHDAMKQRKFITNKKFWYSSYKRFQSVLKGILLKFYKILI